MATSETREQKQDRMIQDILAKTSDEPTQIDEIARIRGWFRPGLYGESPLYSTIQEYLNGKKDFTETTNGLFDFLDAKIVASQKDDASFLDWWYSIIHSAKRISFRDSEAHGSLIELVKAFKDHPTPEKAPKPNVYNSLPDLSMASREAWNDSPGGGAGYFDQEIHAWANVNYFFGRLLKEKIDNSWIFVIWAMRAALENAHKDDSPEDARSNHATAIRKYEAHVPAAAVWVFALGKTLYEKEQDLTPASRNQGNPAKGGELWKGKSEFSKERWALWKKRFGEVGEMEDVNQETRDIAKEAFEAMKEVEST